MEVENRLGLMGKSKVAAKAEAVKEHWAEFSPLMAVELEKQTVNREFEHKENGDGESEMVVCVRVRPRLDHEVVGDSLVTTFASNPSVLCLEPGFNLGKKPRVTSHQFKVDYAFSADDSNDTVYDAVARPCIDLALRGGVSSFLAYGQTGSGKTFTINGILERLAANIIETKGSEIKIHLGFMEMLGNASTDLLNPGVKVDVLEDKFGKVNLVGLQEVEVDTKEQFMELCKRAADTRSTSTTLKNDESSRSHAIVRVRIENTEVKSAEDGQLLVIDLAGAENAADSQFHDKSRIKETKAINSSLMTLKECIKNRAKSVQDPATFVHIPFRQAKLMLVMKDAFELESHKLSRTVVFACVAPTLLDQTMTLNTLRYVGPIKTGSHNLKKVEPDPRNPSNWDNARLRTWLLETFPNLKINLDLLCPFESGKQILRLAEADFILRITKGNPRIAEKTAKSVYDKLWAKLVDARTRERKRKVKTKAAKMNLDQVYGAKATVEDENKVSVHIYTKENIFK